MYTNRLISLGNLNNLPRKFHNLEKSMLVSLIEEAKNLSETGCITIEIVKGSKFSLSIISADSLKVEEVCYPQNTFEFFLGECPPGVYSIVLTERDKAFFNTDGDQISVMDKFLLDPTH